MSTTDAARESARRPDGQFGPQARTELDPANAGLDVPEAPPPTWEEALAHAEVLRAQGVDVSINERYRVIRIRDEDGKLHDASDGTPSVQEFYQDGTPMWISHYTNGYRHDPADGTPARQGFYSDETPKWISHWTNGWRHDPADGAPAYQCFYSDGTPMWIAHYANGWRHDPDDGTPARQGFYPDGSPEWIGHWTNGELVSTESFPPPIGEA